MYDKTMMTSLPYDHYRDVQAQHTSLVMMLKGRQDKRGVEISNFTVVRVTFYTPSL